MASSALSLLHVWLFIIPVCRLASSTIEAIPASRLSERLLSSQVPEEVCEVCGHVYNSLKDCGGMKNPHMDCGEGVTFDSLPEDWLCPVCGVPKEKYHLLHSQSSQAKKEVWECAVCDHVYDPLRDCGGMDGIGEDCGGGVPFESLPSSWRCPVCGVDKAHYHKNHTDHTTHKSANIVMNSIGDIVAQSGIYISVAVLSLTTIMTLCGLVTIRFLVVSLLSASVIACGKFALIGLPPVVVGHAVGMLACWCFMTIGSILGRSVLTSSGMPAKQRALVPHAVIQSCALLFAIVGVTCIFMNHTHTGESQLGLSIGTPLSITLHAIFGWCIVAMMVLQGCQGWLKYFHKTLGKISYAAHAQLGKALLIFASGNIVLILPSFQAQIGSLRVGIGIFAVLITSIIACLTAGPRPALARVHEDGSHYEAMLNPSSIGG